MSRHVSACPVHWQTADMGNDTFIRPSQHQRAGAAELSRCLSGVRARARAASAERPDVAAETLTELASSLRELAETAEALAHEITGDPAEAA
jgi:hypothetical protein